MTISATNCHTTYHLLASVLAQARPFLQDQPAESVLIRIINQPPVHRSGPDITQTLHTVPATTNTILIVMPRRRSVTIPAPAPAPALAPALVRPRECIDKTDNKNSPLIWLIEYSNMFKVE